ncbi:MAG: amidase [Deltaproteobacteria bacterium]|nr:amidase [Deltaproteobacteria bacterium]
MKSKKKVVSAYCDDVLGARDGVELAALIAAGEIQASEVVEAAIARARKVNPALNAIVTETFSQARNQHKIRATGPLAGVPSFIKDNEDFEGVPTLIGTRALPNKPVDASSRFVKHFLSAGLASLGKTTLPEFGLTATTESLATGSTRNPWNIDYSTGGSSGGSAALVAAGVVPLAHGNDGGGSIRIPAACCGLVGLKPSRGRVPDVEGTEKMLVHIVCNGVISRSVRDSAAFYAVMEEKCRNPSLPEIGFVRHPGKDRLRIGLFTDPPHKASSHADSVEVAVNTGKLCEDLGHHVETIACPFEAQIMEDFIIYWGLLAFFIQHFGKKIINAGFDNKKLETWTLGLSRYFKKKFLKAPFILRRLKKFSKHYESFFSGYDILLSPTLSHAPPKIGYMGPEVSFEIHFERIRQYVAFTPMQNTAGAPAISLPMGFSRNGLPIGCQFAAAYGQERRLLELAFEIEEARPWPLVGQH